MSQNNEQEKRARNGEFEEIKSAIPEHLIAGSTPAERHIVSSVSILEQRTNYLHQADIETDAEVTQLKGRHVALDGRVGELEEITNKFKWGWKGIAVLVVSIGSVITIIVKTIAFLGGLSK